MDRFRSEENGQAGLGREPTARSKSTVYSSSVHNTKHQITKTKLKIVALSIVSQCLRSENSQIHPVWSQQGCVYQCQEYIYFFSQTFLSMFCYSIQVCWNAKPT